MSNSNPEALSRLEIPSHKKARRSTGPTLLIAVIVILVLLGVAAYVAMRQKGNGSKSPEGRAVPTATATPSAPAAPPKPGEPVLTVSGYIIPRERIEISPKFQGTVTWIGVKKGDTVKQGDVIVRLEEAEYKARVLEAQGRVALAEANLVNGEANLKRLVDLEKRDVESQRALDDARRARDAALAEVTMAKGQLAWAQTYLDWCTIRAPINGTILEKLVDPNELVVPQSFGGSRGPSTAFVAMADLNDLQVEIDLNEADTPKVHLKQKCRISPEAYPEKQYDGTVAEIAPEANRSKGTLQVKVQVTKPDGFLTPELTAKVEFLAE
jgi:HlyD family secretion protein